MKIRGVHASYTHDTLIRRDIISAPFEVRRVDSPPPPPLTLILLFHVEKGFAR